MGRKQEVNASSINPDEDRYPQLENVIAAINDHPNLPEGPVERIEITCLANGDATFRVWEPRAEESQGGWIPA